MRPFINVICIDNLFILCTEEGVNIVEIRSGSRRGIASKARREIVIRLVNDFGTPISVKRGDVPLLHFYTFTLQRIIQGGSLGGGNPLK